MKLEVQNGDSEKQNLDVAEGRSHVEGPGNEGAESFFECSGGSPPAGGENPESFYTCSGSSPPPIERIQWLLLSFIDSQPHPTTEKDILSAVKARRQIKVRALRLLLSEGHIYRIGGGKKADPYLYGLTNSQKSEGGGSTVIEELVI